ncbi:MAG: alpha-glucuronidase family glycosyl hydrolase [Rhizomicrobium sp.]
MWLRYHAMEPAAQARYAPLATAIVVRGSSPTLKAAADELQRGLSGLLARPAPVADTVTDGAVVLGGKGVDTSKLGPEGYALRSTVVDGHKVTVIAANSDVGVLYGAFAFLKLVQTRQDIAALEVASVPRSRCASSITGTISTARSSAAMPGSRSGDWHKMPDFMDPRYTDYARADASVGINGMVPNNVSSQAEMLTPLYIHRAAALAAVFRPYGIRMYFSARFSAPIEIGGLKTADPLDPAVIAWWKAKADEIYAAIPDFGGFLVKASSEGQPGPDDYHRTQADGANVLADALKPHGGIVMWRAFVYSAENPEDRAKQAL